MKHFLSLILLLASTTIFAQSPSELISNYEFKENAKCEYSSSSMKWCFGQLCYHKETYRCYSNEGSSQLKIKVTQTMRPDGTLKKKAKLISIKKE